MSRKLLVLLLAIGVDRWIRREARQAAAETARRTASALALPRTPRKPPPPPARPASEPDAGRVAEARGLMAGGGHEGSCGPYRLYTDVDDAGIVAMCERVAADLDEVYRERLGLRPRGEPAEAILLFRGIAEFRETSRRWGRGLMGYAGYSDGPRGLVVLYAGGREPDELATTLAHELAHLVHRRAFGPDLPPWLSEGLADAIGDPASERGPGELRGFEGVETQAERLRGGYRNGRAGDLRRLVGLEHGRFDSGAVSLDYEQSALLARYLLLDPHLRSGFRDFLRELAGSGDYEPEGLAAALGLDWEQLERGFRSWLEGSAG